MTFLKIAGIVLLCAIELFFLVVIYCSLIMGKRADERSMRQYVERIKQEEGRG